MIPAEVLSRATQARKVFPSVKLLFWSDGTNSQGNAAWDDPQNLTFAQRQEIADRESQVIAKAAIADMRRALA